MALRTTLEEIERMAREEASLNTNLTLGSDHILHVRQLVKRHYKALVEDFDWKHLVLKREDSYKDLAAGQRYYDFPDNLNPAKISSVWRFWGNEWIPLTEGIDFSHYNVKNSDENERSDPVERWAWYGHNQFEVWPLPASDAGKIGFVGQRKAEELIDSSSRADLDDIMLALYVAGELLMENEQEKIAQGKIAQANARRGRMVVSYSKRIEGATFGGTDPKMCPVLTGINITHIRKAG